MKNESPLNLAGLQGQKSESASNSILPVRAEAVKASPITIHGTRDTCPPWEFNYRRDLLPRLRRLKWRFDLSEFADALGINFQEVVRLSWGQATPLSDHTARWLEKLVSRAEADPDWTLATDVDMRHPIWHWAMRYHFDLAVVAEIMGVEPARMFWMLEHPTEMTLELEDKFFKFRRNVVREHDRWRHIPPRAKVDRLTHNSGGPSSWHQYLPFQRNDLLESPWLPRKTCRRYLKMDGSQGHPDRIPVCSNCVHWHIDLDAGIFGMSRHGRCHRAGQPGKRGWPLTRVNVTCRKFRKDTVLRHVRLGGQG
jgi:hypothetical protein